MITKSFVSLFFLSNKLQIVQLSSNKKKVIKVASVQLPQDVIAGDGESQVGLFYKVKDKSVLTKIIRTTWSKLRINEKTVGIVIPEFSTYTKVFSIPNLNIAELDEAVKWQVQEYLPANSKNLVMDWKIVEKNPDGFQVLAVIMQKDVLMDYVESCESAGLFPMVVETPSLALSKIIDADLKGKLLIFIGLGQALLVIVKGEKILGTSVFNLKEEPDVVKITEKFLNHYKDVQLEKIYFGGDQFTPEFEKVYKDKLKKETLLLSPKLDGITPQSIQEYLIPISMQFKELLEPSDPRTVNLLPPKLVSKYKTAQSRLRVWGISLMMTFFVWVCFFPALAAFLFFNQQISALKNSNSSQNKVVVQRKELASEVKKINDTAQKVENIQKVTFYPESVFNDLANAKPVGVTIEVYEMDLDEGKIRVSGKASDRTSLINFKENLENNQNITSVEIPISSLEVDKDLDFELSYIYSQIASTVKDKKKITR